MNMSRACFGNFACIFPIATLNSINSSG
jgi:hypothetical protein